MALQTLKHQLEITNVLNHPGIPLLKKGTSNASFNFTVKIKMIKCRCFSKREQVVVMESYKKIFDKVTALDSSNSLIATQLLCC